MRFVMLDANLSVQEIMLKFWISLVLDIETISYERRSLNLPLEMQFPSPRWFKLKSLNSEYAVKPRHSAAVRRNLWRNAEGDGNSKGCITGNFCWQSFVGAEWGWLYIDVWLCVCKIRKPTKCDNRLIFFKNICSLFLFLPETFLVFLSTFLSTEPRPFMLRPFICASHHREYDGSPMYAVVTLLKVQR